MESDNAWLFDMVKYARQALERVQGVSHDQFIADIDKQLAVTHLVMIVGEAAAQVSDEKRKEFAALPWGQIVNMRNRIVHHYFKTDLEKVWEVVENDLQVLIDTLEPYLKANPPEWEA